MSRNPTVLDLLGKVAEARKVRADLAEKHAKVIDAFSVAEADVQAAENAFKVEARKTGEKHLAGFGLKVSIKYPVSVSYDAADLLHSFPAARGVAGVIQETVDAKALERAIQLNLIPEDAATRAKRVKEGTPAVTITAGEPELDPGALFD